MRRVPLPATIRARCDLLADLLTGVPLPESMRRRGATLPALSLFAAPPIPASTIDQMTVDDILDILRCCQTADEEGAVLRRLCERLRSRLQAAATAFVSADGVALASDGGRIDKRIVERVIAMGQTVPPHAIDGAIEGGAAVRYGGACLAALVALVTRRVDRRGARGSRPHAGGDRRGTAGRGGDREASAPGLAARP
jgi:hypothetical protein